MLAPLLLASACGVHGLSFMQDTRVDILRPSDRSKVAVPLTVSWSAKSVAIGGGRGSFGVLIDQAPPRSGKTLSWLFRGDTSCKGDTGKALCATPEYLAQHNVFTTTEPRFRVERVDRLTGDQRRRQFHELTVVLLDADGQRIGEGAWSVLFEVKRPV
jgi:hypothetical protein